MPSNQIGEKAEPVDKPEMCDGNPTKAKRQKTDETSADLNLSESAQNVKRRQKKQQQKSKKVSNKKNFVKGLVSGSVGTMATGLFVAT